uniref:Uncharacterized protein n=1 Tax=Spongospora subterranea TaxID=70186 RepID=A0A0H5R5I4_9EUKA|eukprot:CRZ09398.1 hypothetical protein [Spongospora subterranea]
MRGRFEFAQSSSDFPPSEECDWDDNSFAAPLPRNQAVKRSKALRHTLPPSIGTRTLGRPSGKVHENKDDVQWVVSLSAHPGRVNVADAFLIVIEVVEESSSWNQGLRNRDVFVKFGDLDNDGFIASGSSLESLLPIVSKSADSPLECLIIRGQRLFSITLRGMRWDHGVSLGAVINTFPEPVPRSTIENSWDKTNQSPTSVHQPYMLSQECGNENFRIAQSRDHPIAPETASCCTLYKAFQAA